MAALRALSRRCSGVRDAARALPPINPPRRPSSTAAWFLAGVGGSGSRSPVAKSTTALASWLGSRGIRERLGMARVCAHPRAPVNREAGQIEPLPSSDPSFAENDRIKRNAMIYEWLVKFPAFDRVEERVELAKRLNAIPGVQRPEGERAASEVQPSCGHRPSRSARHLRQMKRARHWRGRSSVSVGMVRSPTARSLRSPALVPWPVRRAAS